MDSTDNSESKLAPWQNESASDWLASFSSWKKATGLIHATLKLETKQYPQEIRAAAAMVILFCREGLWPAYDADQLEPILSLAVRQLATIKQMYEHTARSNPDLMTNKKYRDLLTSIDQEIRILESRMSDPKPTMPNEPPCTWGEFWT